MNSEKQFGLYLFKKESQDHKVLKDLLQFVRSHSPSKRHSFSYIEAETSLHPHLSLWENLQVETGSSNWKEFQQGLKPEWQSLVKLLKDPAGLSRDSETWERFLVSLLKGLVSPSHNLLIDMNEDLLSPFMIQQFKKSLLLATQEKNVFLASAHSSLWLDCAHSLVGRKEFKFEIEALNVENLRLKWAI